MEKQPAKINYFFKGGFVEFADTIKDAFERCGDEIYDAKEFLKDTAEELSYLASIWHIFVFMVTFGSSGELEVGDMFRGLWALIKFFFALFKLIFVAILTTLCAGVFSVLHTLILGLCFLVVYIGFFFAWTADKIYCGCKKISTSCPQCQEKYAIPAYVCTCGAKHTKLVPSKYGILKRKCDCGRKLKTTFFNGRHKQAGKWVCPQCGYELGGPLQIDIPIPVVGGPSAGKTCYISMAITELEKNAPSYNLDFEYKPNEMLGDDYADNKLSMGRGQLPLKTSDTRLRYYQFYLTPTGEKIKNLVSICDVAGEAFASNDEMGRQIGFKYANAFLMLVDPLSVTKYREEMAKKIDVRTYRASEKPMDEVLNTLINTLENMKCLTSKTMIKTDVAVVFTKCDIPGLENRIGDEGVAQYMQLHNEPSKYVAKNKVCEQFLIDYEEENFLNSLKSKFKSIQFFTCSALGHVANGSRFAPEGVEEPALWLIDKASASIDLKKKWGKKI